MLHFQSPSFILQSPRYTSPLPGSPARPLWREMLTSRALLYISFRVPSKGAPPLSRFPSQSSLRERRSITRALIFWIYCHLHRVSMVTRLQTGVQLLARQVFFQKHWDWLYCLPSILFNSYTVLFPQELSKWDGNLTTLLHLGPQLWIYGDISPLPHLPSQQSTVRTLQLPYHLWKLCHITYRPTDFLNYIFVTYWRLRQNPFIQPSNFFLFDFTV